MSTRQDGGLSSGQVAQPVASRDELVAWIAAGSKSAEQWRIGTEHEKFVFNTADLSPVPYAGASGIRALMEGLMARFGWVAIMEGEHIIGLKRPKGEGSEAISLEPGGQFELSGAPLATLHQVADETALHLSQVNVVGKSGPWLPGSRIFTDLATFRRAEDAETTVWGDDSLHAAGRQGRS